MCLRVLILITFINLNIEKIKKTKFSRCSQVPMSTILISVL